MLKALAEKLPSVAREVWLLALRARVFLVANLQVALYGVKKCRNSWRPYFSVRARCLRRSCCTPWGDIVLQLDGVWLHWLHALGRYADHERQHCHAHSHYPVTLTACSAALLLLLRISFPLFCAHRASTQTRSLCSASGSTSHIWPNSPADHRG